MACKFCKPDHGGDYPRLWVVLRSWFGVYEGETGVFVSLHGSQFAAETRAKELLALDSDSENTEYAVEEVFVESV